MISVDEARERLLAAAPRLGFERIALADAAGRVLAENVVAGRTQPPFPASAMDGYALRAADAPGPLRLIGRSVAGKGYPQRLAPGEAVRIFTGAPVPDGADAVLIQEDAEANAGSVRATERVTPGDNIRPAGLDFGAGDRLIEPGTRHAPRHLALAGAAGHPTLSVARQPQVAFLATGDELVAPGEPVGQDQIVASVTPTLAALARSAGGHALDLGIAPDEPDIIKDRLEVGLADADILVTLGGASVGEHDLVREALGRLGASLDFWRVAVRPGKPLMFARDPLVLGLPGNPVSGFVCTVLFLMPFLAVMQGSCAPMPPVVTGRLAEPLGRNGPRRDHLRAVREGDRLRAFATQDSSMLATLAAANALVVREPNAEPAAEGEACRFIPLDGWGAL